MESIKLKERSYMRVKITGREINPQAVPWTREMNDEMIRNNSSGYLMVCLLSSPLLSLCVHYSVYLKANLGQLSICEGESSVSSLVVYYWKTISCLFDSMHSFSHRHTVGHSGRPVVSLLCFYHS